MWGARSSNEPPGLSLDGTDVGIFDSADSGLGHSPYSKKSFSGAGTLDVSVACGTLLTLENPSRRSRASTVKLVPLN